MHGYVLLKSFCAVRCPGYFWSMHGSALFRAVCFLHQSKFKTNAIKYFIIIQSFPIVCLDTNLQLQTTRQYYSLLAYILTFTIIEFLL
jgi:hypothetical protein